MAAVKEKYAGHPLRGAMNVNGTIKNNTVNTYMRAVKCFFNYLYRRKYTGIRYTEGLKLPRSDDDQIVPLLEKLLRQYVQVFHPKGTLFRKLEENKGINGSVVKALFQRIVRNTGIERLHPHLLRYTFATSYIMGGGNLDAAPVAGTFRLFGNAKVSAPGGTVPDHRHGHLPA